MFDVVISYEVVDDSVAKTCAAAFEREGWSVGLSNGTSSGQPLHGHARIVIWSQESIASERLARENRDALEDHRLLQLFVEPKPDDRARRSSRDNVIEPPEPFCFYQGLPVRHGRLDGSEWAIDALGRGFGSHDDIVKHVADLGQLTRPSDGWNSRIVFSKPVEGTLEPVTISEYAREGGRLLRRDQIDGNSFIDNAYETTVGNRWQVVTRRDGKLLTEVVVHNDENRVDLPRRNWWRWLRFR
jgi:hypothetical protein